MHQISQSGFSIGANHFRALSHSENPDPGDSGSCSRIKTWLLFKSLNGSFSLFENVSPGQAVHFGKPAPRHLSPKDLRALCKDSGSDLLLVDGKPEGQRSEETHPRSRSRSALENGTQISAVPIS